ncbi:unnamed protein product [Angiostrongylus costaricensis]|uniref:POU domain protein n=1 Tax=Angiostrongylus costaricensis TaxID=334426 RepID=A0A158PEF2_ANGCS|nr:unnamed protein product [Angiostrongylus costaricensis]
MTVASNVGGNENGGDDDDGDNGDDGDDDNNNNDDDDDLERRQRCCDDEDINDDDDDNGADDDDDNEDNDDDDDGEDDDTRAIFPPNRAIVSRRDATIRDMPRMHNLSSEFARRPPGMQIVQCARSLYNFVFIEISLSACVYVNEADEISMEESSYVPLGNEAVIMPPCGSHTLLRVGKSTPSCATGSRRRKGQPVKRKIIECDEEFCSSTMASTADHNERASSVPNAVSTMAAGSAPKSKCDSSFCSLSSSFSSGHHPTSNSSQALQIEPASFAVDPSTIMIDSSNIVVSSSTSEVLATTGELALHMKQSLHNLTSEECPPDPIPNLTNPHKFLGGIVNQSTAADEMELLRRLIVLVGSSNLAGQTAALQLLLSANNTQNLSTSPFLANQYRSGAPAQAPFSEDTKNQTQTILTSLMNKAPADDSGSSGPSSKTCPLKVSRSKIDYSLENSFSETYSMLTSFLSKLAVEHAGTTDKRIVGTKHSEPHSSTGKIPTIPPPSFLKTAPGSPSITSDRFLVVLPENALEITPENSTALLNTVKEQVDVCIRSPNEMHSKHVDGQNGLLNPLSLAARPERQWNQSDMDTMLNSSLFRAFPRMSFRPPVKRKLFDDFSASTSTVQNSRPEIDDLEGFAQHFKKQRIKLGYTQGDVGLALGRKYGTDFSQTTISRFEAMNLSFKNMCKLRPLLKEWLEGHEAAVANGANVEELRSIEISKDKMEDCVDELPIHRPTSIEPLMKRRRKRTNLDLSQVVRVWFCNRRQKLRRSEDLFPMIHSSCRTKAKKSYPVNLSAEMSEGNLKLETAETTTNLY